MKVYITVRKESKYNPGGECTYDGVMEILGVYTSKEQAEELAKMSYKEFYHFQLNNYVNLGDYDDLDGLFWFCEDDLIAWDYTDEEVDGSKTKVQWKVLEWEGE